MTQTPVTPAHPEPAARDPHEGKRAGLAYFNDAQQAFSAGNIKDAIELYRAAADAFERDPELYLERAVTNGQLGISLKAMGEMDEAADRLGRAISLFQQFPENGDAAVSMGNCFWHIGEINEEAGDFDAARISYNQAYSAYRTAPNTQELQIEVLQKLRSI